jgi:heparin binding hemagglutinin HbhA
MPITDDLRKTLADPTPFYAFAGTIDLTVEKTREKAREVPGIIEKLRAEAPERFAAVRAGADPKAVSEKVSVRAKEAQAKFTEIVASFDVKQLRENAQGFALQQVGRAAEAAVRARETYDELAERGRVAVHQLRGEAAEQVEDAAVAIEPSGPSPAAEKAPAAKPAKKTTGRRPAAKKTTPAEPAE